MKKAEYAFRRAMLGIALCRMRLQEAEAKWRGRRQKRPRLYEPTLEEVFRRLETDGRLSILTLLDSYKLRDCDLLAMVHEQIIRMHMTGLTEIIGTLRLPCKDDTLGYTLIFGGKRVAILIAWKIKQSRFSKTRELQLGFFQSTFGIL